MLRLLSCLIISSLLMASWLPVCANAHVTSAHGSNFRYEADLFVKKGNGTDKKAVIISHENEVLKITSAKGDSINKSFVISSLKDADYSYSEKPQVKEALLSTLLSSGFFFGPLFLFSKTKKHWLVLSTEEESFFFQLREDNYRRLLFALNTSGVRVEDLGDRDKKQKPATPPKTGSSSTKIEAL